MRFWFFSVNIVFQDFIRWIFLLCNRNQNVIDDGSKPTEMSWREAMKSSSSSSSINFPRSTLLPKERIFQHSTSLPSKFQTYCHCLVVFWWKIILKISEAVRSASHSLFAENKFFKFYDFHVYFTGKSSCGMLFIFLVLNCIFRADRMNFDWSCFWRSSITASLTLHVS